MADTVGLINRCYGYGITDIGRKLKQHLNWQDFKGQPSGRLV